jgi:pyrroloquinoline-quinone synthase
METTLSSSIQSVVSARSLLNHPFYQAWSRGELTLNQLQGYAKEYYWVAKHVPVVMEAIQKNMPRGISSHQKGIFEHNAREEADHIGLWERFASALGITQAELETYEPSETVMDAVYSIVEQAEQGFEEGVAAMYAFECELSAISETKIEGLQKFYGLNSEDAHAYFHEHLAEEKHLCFWRNLLNNFSEKKAEDCLMASRSTVAAQNRILDGVCERLGIHCGCHAGSSNA